MRKREKKKREKGVKKSGKEKITSEDKEKPQIRIRGVFSEWKEGARERKKKISR